jgi:hypothetical protein
MKKVVLSLMMLGMAFYSNANSTAAVDGSIEVTLSCGIEGTLSWTGDATVEDIVEAVEYFDDLLC